MTATSSVVASNITINSGGVNASGIVSATSYTGSGANLTGVGLSIAPLSYNPDVSDSSVDLTAGIGLTFNQRVFAGVGTVTLSLVSVGSTVVEVLGIGTAVTKTYTVTVASSKFYLDGNQTYSPTLYPGGIYTFDQSAATNGTHPLRFATAADAAGSTEYTTGVETNGTPGSAGAYTRITVAADAPDTLYYYCTNHSGMGSNVSIGANFTFNNDADPPNVTATPKSSLDVNTVIALSYPSGVFVKNDGSSFVGTAYTFATRDYVDQMWMVGNNSKGGLGQNNTTQYSSPVQVPGQWSKFSMGAWHTLVTKTDGTLWGWGDNGGGRLGLNSNQAVDYSSPVQISSDTTWNNVISAAYTTSYAIKTDGTLWTMGSNYYGQLGLNQGQPANVSSPTQIGSGTDWSSITSGLYSVFATKTNGALWSWGYNNTGVLGQNDRAWRSSPVQVPGTTWTSQISSGHTQVLAIKTDGTLWGWGDNERGQLGLNDNNRRSSPVQIPGTTWSTINIGKQQAYATKSDNTFWTWGMNEIGGLGQNSTVKYSSPVQIPGTTWVGGDGGGQENVAVVKTDNTLWTWGLNQSGTLAQNNRTQYSSPVQVPGTSWNGAYGNNTNDAGGVFILTKQV